MREVTKVIWHCSATKEGQDVTVETIRQWHLARGFRDIGYHFVIYRDGTIHKGREVDEVGAHCQQYNDHSIGICYIGGVETDGKTPKDTRTEEQKSSLYWITEKMCEIYPRATVHGHNEFAAKACPSFDARKDWEGWLLQGLSSDITPGLLPEDMRDEDFEPIPDTLRDEAPE